MLYKIWCKKKASSARLSTLPIQEYMKVKASIKADPSKGDILVRRRGRLYVINSKDPNRKQRQKGLARKKAPKKLRGR